MKALRGLIVAIVLQGTCSAQANTNDFTVVKNSDAVTLSERWINKNGDVVRELKAMVQVNAGIEEIIDLLTSNSKGRKWNTGASEYRVIRNDTKNTWLTYTHYDIPWPFEDQDCILLYKIGRHTASETEIIFDEFHDERFLPKPGVIRIKGTHGKWVLERLNNSTLITYYITTDRSLKVPRWCSDIVVHNNMLKTFTALKTILEKE